MKCRTCRWYRKIDDTETSGDCMRYPPKIVTQYKPLILKRPVVDETDYCGEWTETEVESVKKIAERFIEEGERLERLMGK